MPNRPDMNCNEAREQLHDYQRGRLDGEARARIAAHLESCADCRRAAAAESALSSLLADKLPRHAAPPSLQRRLAAQVTAPVAPRVRRPGRYSAPIASALAAAALVLAVVRLTQPSFLRAPVTSADLIE